MKIKLDEQFPYGLVDVLTAMGHEAHSVIQENLQGRSDEVIWRAAQSEGRFLITQDLDFADVRKYAPGSHHGILLLRLRIPGRKALMDRVRSLYQHEDVESWSRCFVLATDFKHRVRRF